MSDRLHPDRARQDDPTIKITVVPVPRIDGALPTRTSVVPPKPLSTSTTPRHRA
ncbi:hypothetical protein EDF24_2622 [Curtobacterium sp. PhB130]|nr:hypothetical protein EDF24_2622 [Curtobacterium sp. PhB130]TCK63803.1 hypothetical protein EDF27_2350 [Curtobacterium sp. PhB136]